MQNVLAIWSSLDLRRRAIVIGATVAMFAAILGLSRLASRADMVLLYAGLEPATAGEVVAALDQRGVPYEVAGNSILVDSAQRDSLRMALAAEGLPAAGGAGYELLDSLSGFGTTSQMFDAAYWRAKEGELARTLLAMPEVKAARVHIATAPVRTFQNQEQASASVTLTTAGGTLSEAQARAIRHLVASAVAGMRPDAVQIIDTVSGLIGGDGAEDFSEKQASDRAATIRGNVERLLAARVGPGKAVVEVTVELVSDTEQITERTFDPQGRVAISTETEESSDSSTEPGGSVTVASNLPEGAANDGSQGKSESATARERVNFEVSEVQREILRGPGTVKRMTVAVLVDGVVSVGADGARIWEPRPEDELATLRELVAAAVGFDEQRGDVLTLRSLEFQETPVLAGTDAASGLTSWIDPLDVLSLVQVLLLAIVALVLGLFVLRPILTSSSGRAAIAASAPTLALPPMAAVEGGRVSQSLDGELDLDFKVAALGQGLEGGDPDFEATDPASRLRRLIAERQAESIEILRSWMEREEEPA